VHHHSLCSYQRYFKINILGQAWYWYCERVALPWELLYADDMAVIAETEEELIKRLNEWKDNVESKGMRVNMNKTKVMNDKWRTSDGEADGY